MIQLAEPNPQPAVDKMENPAERDTMEAVATSVVEFPEALADTQEAIDREMKARRALARPVRTVGPESETEPDV